MSMYFQMDTKMANDSEITVFGLYDFPDELLLHVMGHLNDKNLLNMTQVCKRFKAIAQDAFAKKYNGDTGKDYYALKVHSANMTEQHKQYRPFFTRFGANMTALEITFIDESPDANSHWIMGLIQRYCKSLAKITVIGGSVNLSGIISRMPKPTLTHLRLEWVSTTNHSWSEYNHPKLIYLQVTTWSWAMTPFEVKNFIDNNRQLREIHLDGDFFAMDSILQICSGILNQLEYLRIYRKNDRVFALMTTPIYLERLKKLEIEFSDASGESWLRSIAMGCKNIEILHLDNSLTGSIIWNDKKIEHLCEFGQLKSLKLCAVNLSVNYIKQMVQKLPNLSSITLYNAGGDINNNLLEVIAICSKLTNLSIKLDPTSTTDYVISRIFNLDFNLLSQIAEATERNRGMKITLKSYHQELKIVSTQGEVRYGNSTVFHSGYDPINNQAKTLLDLGDECLEKIIGYLDMNAQAALYNTCTKTQRAIKYHLLNTVFYVHVYGMQYLSNTIDEHSFECLAPSIRQMIVERDLSIEQWEHLNLHCTRLNELCMAFPQNPIIYQTSLLWSNLRKLTLQCCSATDLRFFDCPLLTHLEVFFISSYYENWMHTLDFTDKFQHLTALKITEVVFLFFSSTITMTMLNNFSWHSMRVLSTSCRSYR
ncbi:uncharacterized protein LOC129565496 isoform X2 [Sitodiplosis mosellana]|uniref:uncharacterized protein LOC129565496 isoform X2 n=1 Tax=Sitodiplosis mosellana TaxID=263140 RepID=UPI0024452250|nr:uncharacterized protein LOC129565496 isoform X2 [Sitodiplosis mosellana]